MLEEQIRDLALAKILRQYAKSKPAVSTLPRAIRSLTPEQCKFLLKYEKIVCESDELAINDVIDIFIQMNECIDSSSVLDKSLNEEFLLSMEHHLNSTADAVLASPGMLI